MLVINVGEPHQLDRTISSLVRQSPRPEIVVVHGPPNKMPRNPSANQNITQLVISSRGLWQGAARNLGIEATPARWLAFLEAGSEVGAGWTSARLSQHRSGAGLVIGSVFDERTLWPAPVGPTDGAAQDIIQAFLAGVSLQSASFDRALVERAGGFREDIPFEADWEVFSRFAMATPSLESQTVRDDLVSTFVRAPVCPLVSLDLWFNRGLCLAYFEPRRYRLRLPRRLAMQFARLVARPWGPMTHLLSRWLRLPSEVTSIVAFELGARDGVRLRNRARRADEQGRHDESVAAYREVWKRIEDPGALVRLVDIFLGQGEPAMADEIVETARAVGAAARVFPLVAAHRYQVGHEWDRVLEVLEGYPDALARDISLLAAYANSAFTTGSPERALVPIQRYKGTVPDGAKWLLLEAQLRCRRYEAALEEFNQMAPDRQNRLPGRLLGALLTSALHTGGALRAAEVLEAARSTSLNGQTAAPHRLTTSFYKERIATHLRIARSVPLRDPDIPLERQIAEQLRERGGTPAHLAAVCDLFSRLREECDGFLPDPQFVLSEALEVARRIMRAVDSRTGFSLIRLGDGEGNLLPYPPQNASFVEMDYRATARAWWARDLVRQEYLDLQNLVIEAIENADIIGVPDLHRLCGGAERSKNSRGLMACLDHVKTRMDTDATWARRRIVTSCHVHQALSYWHLWDILLPRMKAVSLITCHAHLADKLSETHGICVDVTHLVPGEAKYASAIGALLVGSHFPDRFAELAQQLSKPQGGGIYLVAAGVLGKAYCTIIAKNGGIALDVGSVADEWAGLQTRSLEEISNYFAPSDPRALDYIRAALEEAA